MLFINNKKSNKTENNNNIGIDIFGYENKIFPIYNSKCKFEDELNQ